MKPEKEKSTTIYHKVFGIKIIHLLVNLISCGAGVGAVSSQQRHPALAPGSEAGVPCLQGVHVSLATVPFY